MFTRKGIGAAFVCACALAFAAWSGGALAAPTNVNGVVIDPSSPLDLQIEALNFRETSIDAVSDTLLGYGRIGSINGTDPDVFCPGCDLTFTFQYTVANIDTTGANPKVVFNLGTINFYVDDTQSFNVLDPDSADNGTLWLTLSGHAAPYTGFSTVGELYATVLGTLVNPQNGSTGFGLLDATGGPAMAYVDTNKIADGEGGFADFSLNSSFQFDGTQICSADGTCYPIGGQGGLLGRSPMAVPEPGAMGLLGFGLGLLGLLAWRRRKEGEDRV